jgi:hypothetical protein
MNTRFTPLESFPEDLTSLPLPDVEVLNSKIQRELSYEFVHNGELDPETEFRNEELAEELDRRDAVDTEKSAGDASRSLGSAPGIARPW